MTLLGVGARSEGKETIGSEINARSGLGALPGRVRRRFGWCTVLCYGADRPVGLDRFGTRYLTLPWGKGARKHPMQPGKVICLYRGPELVTLSASARPGLPMRTVSEAVAACG